MDFLATKLAALQQRLIRLHDRRLGKQRAADGIRAIALLMPIRKKY